MVVGAATVPPALTVITQVFQRYQETARTARTGLQGTTGASGGVLPLAHTADLETRVHRAVLPIPYIHRDDEDVIGALLQNGRPALLIGSSMVGKTKMAARIIAERFSSWPVAIPDSRTALADLDAKDVTLSNSVIWLDDIERLIGTGGITEGALQRLSAAHNVIIGTIRASAYERFRPSDQLRPPEWDVLSTFEHVFVSRELTPNEQARLAQAVSDPEILKRIRSVGLGEYAGAAAQVAEALKLGAAGADSVGYALVLGAADWRRCGLIRPVPVTVLPILAEPHLDERRRTRLSDKEAFSAGLAWAIREINPSVSLLQPSGLDSYIIYDYALDLISRQNVPVPAASWAVVMTNADPSELIGIGYTAEVTYHQTETAIQAFSEAAHSGHAYAAPMAARNLGVLLAGQGDTDGAKSAYQQAIDSGHPVAAPMAIVNLGNLLARQGDADGAKSAYQQAIDSGHAVAAPMAARNLGLVLAGQGDADGAKSAYRRAIDSGHGDATPMAMVNLADLLAAQGDADGAKSAYQQAIDSGHAVAAPMAAHNLGLVQAGQEGANGRQSVYRPMHYAVHADVAPMAIANLGSPLSQRPGSRRLEQGVIVNSRKSSDKTWSFPVLEQKPLPLTPRKFLQRAKPDLSQLLQARPDTALVFRTGGRWIVFDNHKPRTEIEEDIGKATAVSLIDLSSREYIVRVIVSSENAAEDLTVDATFLVKVTDPGQAAAEGPVNIADFLKRRLARDSHLFRPAGSYQAENLVELTELRDEVTARFEAYNAISPISMPGLSITLLASAVVAPEAPRERERQQSYQRMEERLRNLREHRRLLGEGSADYMTVGLTHEGMSSNEFSRKSRHEKTDQQLQAAAMVELLQNLMQNGALDYMDVDPAEMVSKYIEKLTGRLPSQDEGVTEDTDD
jgi:tetratricopeptide (TPR) repeat protein